MMTPDEYMECLRHAVTAVPQTDWASLDDDLFEEYTEQLWWLVNFDMVQSPEADALRDEIRRLAPWV